MDAINSVPKPTTNVVPTPPSPSKWLTRGTYADDIKTRNLHVLCYGHPKSGKTQFMGTWPGLYVIDADNGLTTIRSKHVFGFQPKQGEKTFVDIMDLIRDIKMKRNGFEPGGIFGDIQTLGIDTISKLSELIKYDTMVNPIAGAAKDPATQKADFDNWGYTKQRLADIVAAANELPINTVVTAWVEVTEDEASGAKIAMPKTEGKYREVMAGNFDEVYYFDIQQGNPNKYLMRTCKYGIYIAGSRLGLPAVIENPSYDALQAALNGMKR